MPAGMSKLRRQDLSRVYEIPAGAIEYDVWEA
jgi:hypothetical protein